MPPLAEETSIYVYRVRTADVDWVREESRRRGIEETEWWVGWSAPVLAGLGFVRHGEIRLLVDRS